MIWAPHSQHSQESLRHRLHRMSVSLGLEGQPILSSHTVPNHPSPEKRTCQLWGTFLQRAAATIYSLDAEPQNLQKKLGVSVHPLSLALVSKQRQEDSLKLTRRPAQLNLRAPVSKENMESNRGRHPALSAGLHRHTKAYELHTRKNEFQEVTLTCPLISCCQPSCPSKMSISPLPPGLC